MDDDPPGMVPSSQPDETESLGIGFERQFEGIKSFQDQLSKYGDDLQKLQARCSRLKRECTKLQQDKSAQEREYFAKGGEMTTLNRAIEGLRGERDSLQIELAAMCEEERVWRTADQAGLQELDRAGRLARQLWLRNEEVTKLKEHLDTINDEHQDHLRAEAETADQLRQRIAKLERKLRHADTLRGTPKDVVEKLTSLEHKSATLKEELRRARQHYDDAQEALQEQSKAKRLLEQRMEALEEEKRAALEETRVAKQQWKTTQEAYAALRKQLESAKGKQAIDENPRVLQCISPNVSTRSQTPAPSTPSKSQPFDDTNLSQLSPKSRDKAFQHLMNQNASLKEQLDRERAKRAADIKHFKEYKAVQDERKALKQKRREERAKAESASRSANATPISSSVPPPSDPPALFEEDQVSEAAPRPSARAPSPPPEQRPAMHTIAPAYPEETAEARPPPRGDVQPNRVRSASTSKLVTSAALKQEVNTPLRRTNTNVPAPSSAPKTLSRAPSRVTPWLGGTPSSSKSARKLSRVESCGSDKEDKAVTPTASRPLVRDRTGTASLLKTALHRTTIIGGPTAAPEATGPSTPSSVSRKHSLDFEHLSPGERAAQRRKLNQMSAAEKREFYAQYKSGGRYLRPEEVARSVADEFEIDPARNNGVAHKYHETVRNRDARRQMHGGDCECCREYYEAIGPLPRFNQGPAWKRTENDEDNLVEHRNRVSRHRETWQRPASPPDFWKIGFPSTQDVEAVNAKADVMVRGREEEVRREAARKDSKWRRKGAQA